MRIPVLIFFNLYHILYIYNGYINTCLNHSVRNRDDAHPTKFKHGCLAIYKHRVKTAFITQQVAGNEVFRAHRATGLRMKDLLNVQVGRARFKYIATSLGAHHKMLETVRMLCWPSEHQ